MAFRMPVEASRIAELRRAIGDSGSGRQAPPTFVVVADQFDPDFDRRPRPGEPWPPPGGIEARLHVEQRIDLSRAVHAGETLTVRRLEPNVWRKEGRRGGQLEFIELVTELVDDGGDVVVRSAWVDVRPERGHAAMSAPVPPVGADPPPEGARAVVVAAPVTRTHLVMYVGVTGDFHPLHHDEAYAVANGYPSVFAPGMLTMAWAVLAARVEVAEEDVAAVGGRFRAQVWPGDVLTAYVSRTETGCDVSTRNHDGVAVFDGWVRRRV